MNDLLALFDKYGCDKGTKKHRYDEIYSQHFEPLRLQPIKILEIGVFRGASTRALLEYFPNAIIVGLDIYERVSLKDLGISDTRFIPVKGSSFNPKTVEMLPNGIKFDIIIDDGAHWPQANRVTFENYFPLLKEDGKYFIEDVWPLEKLNAKNHPWVQKQQGKYNMKEHKKFISAINQHTVTVYNQNNPKHPDSTIYMIEK